MVVDEIARYDAAMQAAMRDEHVPQLNPEQRAIYDNVMAVVNRRAFFVDGLGGTGKTFLYSCLLSTVRTQGRVAVAMASSGIAARRKPHCTFTFQEPCARPQQHVHMLH
jgi:ATP-dependent DNA helicase PIF1